MLRSARGSDVQSMQVMFHRMSSEDFPQSVDQSR
jgi:hypothetical protein